MTGPNTDKTPRIDLLHSWGSKIAVDVTGQTNLLVVVWAFAAAGDLNQPTLRIKGRRFLNLVRLVRPRVARTDHFGKLFLGADAVGSRAVNWVCSAALT